MRDDHPRPLRAAMINKPMGHADARERERPAPPRPAPLTEEERKRLLRESAERVLQRHGRTFANLAKR